MIPSPGIFANIGRHWRSKLGWHATLSLWMTALYYGPQKWPIFTAHAAPMLPLDLWIPFQPAWALVYQSVFVANTLALWLPSRRESVILFGQAMAIVFACGAIVFWIYPTVSPRPPHSDSILYNRLIVAVDGPRNALPSLHAAMGLLAAYVLMRHLRGCGASLPWRAGLGIWWASLLYSTLATRQHRILDLIAGVALAGLSLVFLQSKTTIPSSYEKTPNPVLRPFSRRSSLRSEPRPGE